MKISRGDIYLAVFVVVRDDGHCTYSYETHSIIKDV